MGSKHNLQYVVCSKSRASGIFPGSSLPWVLLIFYKKTKLLDVLFCFQPVTFALNHLVICWTWTIMQLHFFYCSHLLEANTTRLILNCSQIGCYCWKWEVRRNAPSMIHFTMVVLCCWGHNIHSTIIYDAQHLLNAPHLSGFTQTNVGLSLLWQGKCILILLCSQLPRADGYVQRCAVYSWPRQRWAHVWKCTKITILSPLLYEDLDQECCRGDFTRFYL